MNTPFLQIGPTFQYYNKKDAYEQLKKEVFLINQGCHQLLEQWVQQDHVEKAHQKHCHNFKLH
ncbi:unnamed protein product [Paramecium sonneborni]|uniref:Uncharacterized protein n=1 Tax=Paramecium sonneborni TaxID=65129 RepID=A0A8S1RF79_9CILI|nr:unnamed protein product [Paramecium sonneborni]